MTRKWGVILALCLGVTGCSGQQLTRSTAQRILRENMASGQFDDGITVKTDVQAGYLEQMWRENGFNVEVQKLYVELEISFLNHLVEAGILQKAPDTYREGCNPQPDCREHNKWFNFSVIPQRDVKDWNKGSFIQDANQEKAEIVLARPSNPIVTGITQEGIDAIVEFTYGYSPTPLYARLVQLTKGDFAKCSIPELSSNSPLFCLIGGRWGGHWLSEADIAAKKDSGSLEFRKYDDGWRIVK